MHNSPEGGSLAEMARRAVDRFLESQEGERRGAVRRALSVTGRFAWGTDDGAEEHDRYLAEG